MFRAYELKVVMEQRETVCSWSHLFRRTCLFVLCVHPGEPWEKRPKQTRPKTPRMTADPSSPAIIVHKPAASAGDMCCKYADGDMGCVPHGQDETSGLRQSGIAARVKPSCPHVQA